jgi:hypothetical protein
VPTLLWQELPNFANTDRCIEVRSHFFMLQQAINLQCPMGKAIVFTWIGRDAMRVIVSACAGVGDRFGPIPMNAIMR